MPSPTGQFLIKALKEAGDGAGGYPRLVAAMRRHSRMIMVIAPKDFDRFVTDLDDKLRERREQVERGERPEDQRYVDWSEVGEARVLGHNDERGFVPFAFTDVEFAERYCREHRNLPEGAPVPLMKSRWASGLHRFLMRGYDGVIIDEGTDHRLQLSRRSVGMILGQITLQEFARAENLHVLMSGRKVHLQSARDTTQAFVYLGERAADKGLALMRKRAPAAAAAAVPTHLLLRQLLRRGVGQVIVNPMLPDQRFYLRGDLLRMWRLLNPDSDGSELTTPSGGAPRAPGAAEAAAASLLGDPFAEALGAVPKGAADDDEPEESTSMNLAAMLDDDEVIGDLPH